MWLEAEEIAAIAAAGASVVLNPQGNLKTRSGIAPIGTYREMGVNVALGCDNCSCNNSQSMLQAMKIVCRAWRGRAAVRRHAAGGRCVALGDDGRRTRARDARCGRGSLSACAADIVLFRLDDMCFVPLNSAVRQLVFGDAAPALDKVIVDGRLVVADGRLLTIDLAALRREAEAYAAELRSELGEIIDRVTPLYGDIERAAKRAQATEWRLSHYRKNESACEAALLAAISFLSALPRRSGTYRYRLRCCRRRERRGRNRRAR